MPGQQDLWPWLQSIIANQGAANPNDPNAIPPAAPQAMPGSGLNGMPAMTQGGPSMGFPAQTNPFGAQPSQPVSAGDDSGFNNPYQAAGNSFFPGAAPGQGGIGSDARFAPSSAPAYQGGGIGSDARFPLSTAPAGSPSATPKSADAKGPLASPGATATPMKRTPGAPNLGYYAPNPRFGTVQYQTPNSSASRAPIYTALNLGGGGQQQAANPANVPAANAQPVSAAAPNGQSNAPLDYGPLQQGNSIWDMLSKAPWNYGPQQRGRRWNPDSNDYSP